MSFLAVRDGNRYFVLSDTSTLIRVARANYQRLHAALNVISRNTCRLTWARNGC